MVKGIKIKSHAILKLVAPSSLKLNKYNKIHIEFVDNKNKKLKLIIPELTTKFGFTGALRYKNVKVIKHVAKNEIKISKYGAYTLKATSDYQVVYKYYGISNDKKINKSKPKMQHNYTSKKQRISKQKRKTRHTHLSKKYKGSKQKIKYGSINKGRTSILKKPPNSSNNVVRIFNNTPSYMSGKRGGLKPNSEDFDVTISHGNDLIYYPNRGYWDEPMIRMWKHDPHGKRDVWLDEAASTFLGVDERGYMSRLDLVLNIIAFFPLGGTEAKLASMGSRATTRLIPWLIRRFMPLLIKLSRTKIGQMGLKFLASQYSKEYLKIVERLMKIPVKKYFTKANILNVLNLINLDTVTWAKFIKKIAPKNIKKYFKNVILNFKNWTYNSLSTLYSYIPKWTRGHIKIVTLFIKKLFNVSSKSVLSFCAALVKISKNPVKFGIDFVSKIDSKYVTNLLKKMPEWMLNYGRKTEKRFYAFLLNQLNKLKNIAKQIIIKYDPVQKVILMYVKRKTDYATVKKALNNLYDFAKNPVEYINNKIIKPLSNNNLQIGDDKNGFKASYNLSLSGAKASVRFGDDKNGFKASHALSLSGVKGSVMVGGKNGFKASHALSLSGVKGSVMVGGKNGFKASHALSLSGVKGSVVVGGKNGYKNSYKFSKDGIKLETAVGGNKGLKGIFTTKQSTVKVGLSAGGNNVYGGKIHISRKGMSMNTKIGGRRGFKNRATISRQGYKKNTFIGGSHGYRGRTVISRRGYSGTSSVGGRRGIRTNVVINKQGAKGSISYRSKPVVSGSVSYSRSKGLSVRFSLFGRKIL
ncbi:hypothetical protein [Methanobrevibacter filiformis]|uniref:Uncharacterized protein n=1 Tax=Methanobrevibacter filiformis TaxID=55758 RepID=A0A165ZA57_9EURY|nr:hypothetical protein [Methanobrevibacter filiformis]KZX10462.1 hypothetical protein MBFIL_17610 [Methanobrevibacter filiformis]